MSELSHDAKSLLRAARTAGLPSPAALERVQHGLESKLGISLGVGAGVVGAGVSAGSSAASAGATAAKAGWWAVAGKFVAATVVSVSVASAGVGLVLRSTTARETHAATTLVQTTANRRPAHGSHRDAPGLEAHSTEEIPEPNDPPMVFAVDEVPADAMPANRTLPLPPPDRAAPAHHAASTSAGASRVEPHQTPPPAARVTEISGLTAAWSAMRAGDPARALAMLEGLSVTYPNGALIPERTAARAMALCALGRRREGRAEAGQLLRTWPRSPYAARLRASCGLEP